MKSYKEALFWPLVAAMVCELFAVASTVNHTRQKRDHYHAVATSVRSTLEAIQRDCAPIYLETDVESADPDVACRRRDIELAVDLAEELEEVMQ